MELVHIGVGYIKLNRGIASISGGELQRVRLAKQIAMKLSGYCYVIDEPSTGLHYFDISCLVDSLFKLKGNGNTVLVIEHNKYILSHCDDLIELGPKGGKNGGYVIATGKKNELIKDNTLLQELSKSKLDLSMKITNNQHWIILQHIAVNNLKNIDLKIPLNMIVCVAGVSGSGKSSAIECALYNSVSEYLCGNTNNKNLSIGDNIRRIVILHQDSSVIGVRSTVATLLDIMSYIRTIFANADESKCKGWDSSDFSTNSNGRAICSFCKGKGYIIDDDGLSAECPMCDGTGFSDEALEITYNGYNISEIMHMDIDELINIIDDDKIKHLLSICRDLGLGYLSIVRNGAELSKGEYQRLRLASEIYNAHEEHTLLILDEPSRGLHYSDVQRLISCLRKLLLNGHSIVVIEHNISIILQSDYVIEFGPGAGNDGGTIVYEGIPNELINKKTHTAQAIKLLEQDYATDIYNNKIIANKTTCEYAVPLNYLAMNYPSSIKISKNKINIIRGTIGSGKTQLMRKLLYANPLKKYIASISAQGKYLTRDIEAWPSGGLNLPLTRIIDCEQKFYWKDERVAETLNLNHFISKLFFINNKAHNILFKNTFDTSKNTGKCSVCKGAGRLHSYDFDVIFSNKELLADFYKLILERTRFNRIQPLLNKIYNIDIAKPFEYMTDIEKRVFLFGDRNASVFYEPKQKIYTWDGCNDILSSNLAYATEKLKNAIQTTYDRRICRYCNGIGVDIDIAKCEYKSISYSDFLTHPIEKLLNVLQSEKTLCNDEQEFISYLETMVRLNLGDIRLGDYISDVDIVLRDVIKYLSYKFNPLFNSVIIWDNFSMGKSDVFAKLLFNDMEAELKNGTSIILIDNNILSENANNILIDDIKNKNISKSHSLYQPSTKYGCFFEKITTSKEHEVVHRDNIVLSNKTTIGSITGCTSMIKNKFKVKFAKNLFSGDERSVKCEKCDGRGWYEINLEDIWFSKFRCSVCNGSGFSSDILNYKIDDKNIAMLLMMPIIELYSWATRNNYDDIVIKLQPFINIGISDVSLSRGMSELSYNEVSMVLICKFLIGIEPVFYMKDAFKNIYADEFSIITSNVNNECIRLKKKIVLIEGDKI